MNQWQLQASWSDLLFLDLQNLTFVYILSVLLREKMVLMTKYSLKNKEYML